MKQLVDLGFRYVNGWQRPSRAVNEKGLRARGERMDSFTIRGATSADVDAIARLHVDAFNQTHLGGRAGGPTFELRQQQWREKLTDASTSWFCFVVESKARTLVGFAAGHPMEPESEFGGRLNKIYLLRDYQRLGLGRRLVSRVANRFMSRGITSMALFTEVSNPSCWFFESLGAERILDPKGEFGGMYAWRDLKRLTANLPTE